MWGKHAQSPFLNLVYTVHPHACGGNDVPFDPRTDAQLVHPHACGGNVWQNKAASSAERFIPTHVGETKDSPKPSKFISVHPHACGGNAEGQGQAACGEAVHPHACGGNGGGKSAFLDTITVHPHACGGNVNQEVVVADLDTVHPHACGGNAFGQSGGDWRIRFIPTHVGETIIKRFVENFHPGSSPRMWGKPSQFLFLSLRRSVHPHACGGNVDMPS